MGKHIFLHEDASYLPLKVFRWQDILYLGNPSFFVLVFQEIWGIFIWMNGASCGSPPSLHGHLI